MGSFPEKLFVFRRERNKSLFLEIGKIFSNFRKSRKKFINLLKNITINVNDNILLSVFRYNFFSLSDFLRGHKIQINFEIISARTLFRPVIPTLRECQETELVFNFPSVATHFSPENNVQFSHLGLNKKLLFRAKVFV